MARNEPGRLISGEDCAARADRHEWIGHRTRDVEVKDRLGSTGPDFGQTAPAGISGTGLGVAAGSVADEIDVGVVLVGRPVALKIIEEHRPVRRDGVDLEITQRKRKGVVYPDKGR